MSIKNTVEQLRSDIVIPDVVNERVRASLIQIRVEQAAKESNEQTVGEARTDEQQAVIKAVPQTAGGSGQRSAGRRPAPHRRRMLLAASLAAVLLIGAVTAAAATLLRTWTHSMEATLKPSSGQKAQAEETGLIENPVEDKEQASQTVNDISVTAEQTLVDDYYALISFKVEGKQFSEGTEPSFGNFDIDVEGVSCNMSASFYDGLLPGPDGTAMQENGEPFEINEDGSLKTYYLRDDGSYEFNCTLMTEDKGAFFGKPVTAVFEDFGYEKGKLEHETVAEGRWELKWNLSGGSDSTSFVSGEALGDTGAVLEGAEISPISINLRIHFPYSEYEDVAVDEEGNESPRTFPVDPPWPYGLKLKDGTLLLAAFDGPGITGYTDKDSGSYESRMQLARMVTPKDVAAVLFVKNGIEAGSTPTEEDFYVAAVKEQP